MNRYLLTRFIKEAMLSPNPQVAQQAGRVDDVLSRTQENESITDAAVIKQEHPELNTVGQLDNVDQLFQQAMPELAKEDKPGLPSVDSNDKYGSAYIKDIPLNTVPGLPKADRNRFSTGGKEVMVVQYGMVVTELLPKVDKHNFDLATAHIKKDWDSRKMDELKDEVYAQAKNKYILLLNDSIIDGHHFLAKAQYVGLTSSLNVIDLTPARFQKTASKATTTWDMLVEHYGHSDNGWKNPFEKRSTHRVSQVRGNT